VTAIDDLLADLTAAIGGRATTYNTRSAAWDVYEGFVFGLVVRAAVAAGGTATYEDVHGNPATTRLVFRTSPGMLHSTAHDYTHAVINLPDCDPLEVHVGVRVQGRSGVLHECDVLVLPSTEAVLARTKSVAPRGARSLLAVECKYYTSYLSLYLARGFHGLHSDLGLKHPFFVANIRAARIERYLSYHHRRWENGVMPSTSEATYLEGLIRDAFKQHIAVRGTLTP
jgi:hypothetical protein